MVYSDKPGFTALRVLNPLRINSVFPLSRDSQVGRVELHEVQTLTLNPLSLATKNYMGSHIAYDIVGQSWSSHRLPVDPGLILGLPPGRFEPGHGTRGWDTGSQPPEMRKITILRPCPVC